MTTIPKGEFLSGDEKKTDIIKFDYKMDVVEVSNASYHEFAALSYAEAKKYAHPDEPLENNYQPNRKP